jgi:hypothetical protein
MDVFLYRERDGRLVDDCAGLAMGFGYQYFDLVFYAR